MKFLVIDHHLMLRDGVAAVLRQFDAGAAVLFATRTGAPVISSLDFFVS